MLHRHDRPHVVEGEREHERNKERWRKRERGRDREREREREMKEVKNVTSKFITSFSAD